MSGATTANPPATASPQSLTQTLNVGVNTVTLTVSSGAGCSTVYSQVITVSAVAVAPVSGIALASGTQTQCLIGNSYSFNASTSGGTPTSYQWYFYGGATPSSSTAQNPTGITFGSAGTHQVTLTVSNSAGNSTASYNVTILNAATPNVTTTGNTYFCANATGATLTAPAETVMT